jgi:hypothetical protein
MTTEADNTTWAITALDMAFSPPLHDEARDEAVAMILRYFNDAAAKGISLEHARTALHNEFLDTAPVIEPLKRLLQRTLKTLRESV